VTYHVSIPGAAAVGHISDLEPLEGFAVLYLRLWCDSPTTQEQVWNDFAGRLGPAAGREAVRALEDLCSLCARHGRRALIRHQLTCQCLGADEACFANLVAHAVDGEREDALLIATLLVRPDVSPLLASAAQTFGLALKRMALRTDHKAEPAAPQTIH